MEKNHSANRPIRIFAGISLCLCSAVAYSTSTGATSPMQPMDVVCYPVVVCSGPNTCEGHLICHVVEPTSQ